MNKFPTFYMQYLPIVSAFAFYLRANWCLNPFNLNMAVVFTDLYGIDW